MARPRKTGLDYFPFDVDFFSDEKVVCIGGEFGVKGELTMIRLLCAVYRNGYFVLWNDNLKYKLKREMDGVSVELLEQIVQALVRRGFFDESLFDSESVLTSEGIQRRYFEAARFRQRDQDLPYLLIKPRRNYTKTNISQWETPVSQQLSTQIKRNKIKISSDEDKKDQSPPAPSFNEETFVKEFFGEEGDQKRKGVVEQLSRSLGFSDSGAMRRVADGILSDWALRRHVPKDWEDAAAHLVATLKKKARQPVPSPAANAPKSRTMAELDRKADEREWKWREQERRKESPDNLIRRMGYDPARVTVSQAFNPEWRKNNPPDEKLIKDFENENMD
ncbi:MAG: DUF4373 domain-containing protein [Bacteroides sp.]|nr:DUF4373 domain-containing protein [Bacteroides sp.]